MAKRSKFDEVLGKMLKTPPLTMKELRRRKAEEELVEILTKALERLPPKERAKRRAEARKVLDRVLAKKAAKLRHE